MKNPPVWTKKQINADVKRAIAVFRRERLEEPLELYSAFFKTFVDVFKRLLHQLPTLTAPNPNIKKLIEIVADADANTAFRYIAAPPISEDDLKTLAETTLSSAALKKNEGEAKRVRDIVLQIIDPHRFPWIGAGRSPTRREIEIAIISSAALVAAKKVETRRRMRAKDEQEEDAKKLLRGIGFKEVPRREIPLLKDAPKPGEFCGESRLGDTRGDIIVGLFDGRVMPIECKVSNSEINSFKRVNHEAVRKTEAWLKAFGSKATVPAAILSGVFKADNLLTAQDAGLAVFWAHRLDDLKRFIRGSRR